MAGAGCSGTLKSIGLICRFGAAVNGCNAVECGSCDEDEVEDAIPTGTMTEGVPRGIVDLPTGLDTASSVMQSPIGESTTSEAWTRLQVCDDPKMIEAQWRKAARYLAQKVVSTL